MANSQAALEPVLSLSTIPENFSEMGVSKWLVDSLGAMAMKKPTPIQAACIEPILQGLFAHKI